MRQARGGGHRVRILVESGHIDAHATIENRQKLVETLGERPGRVSKNRHHIGKTAQAFRQSVKINGELRIGPVCRREDDDRQAPRRVGQQIEKIVLRLRIADVPGFGGQGMAATCQAKPGDKLPDIAGRGRRNVKLGLGASDDEAGGEPWRPVRRAPQYGFRRPNSSSHGFVRVFLT